MLVNGDELSENDYDLQNNLIELQNKYKEVLKSLIGDEDHDEDDYNLIEVKKTAFFPRVGKSSTGKSRISNGLMDFSSASKRFIPRVGKKAYKNNELVYAKRLFVIPRIGK